MDQARYLASAPSTFRCFDGGAELAFAAVNDDFCDCQDGSDEPGTGACAGGSTLYYCANELSDPKFIYSSRVNDGICDCCDGSDEWVPSRSSSSCPNTCAEHGRAARRAREQREAEVRDGIKQRSKLIQTARTERANQEKELAKLRRELPQLEGAEKAASEALEAARAQLRQKEVVVVNKTSESAPDSQEGAQTEPSPEAEAAPAEGDGAVVSEYAKWMEGAEEALEKPSESSPEGAEKVEDLAAVAAEEEALRREAEKASEGFLQRLLAKVRSVFGGLFAPGKSPAERAVEQAEKAHTAALKSLSEGRKRLEELQKKTSSSGENEEELAYTGLEGRCITKKFVEYKYEVCFFKDAKQDSVLVGHWKSWEAPGVALFDNGQYCPGGPARSLRVKFTCGSSEELLEVGEPSRCSYEASIKHPAACSESLLEVIAERRAKLPTEEL